MLDQDGADFGFEEVDAIGFVLAGRFACPNPTQSQQQ
jgi:hypothetical protein